MLSFFLIGLIFGSFFNVVGLRLPRHESFVTGHSYCPNCKERLRWFELIPLLSYVTQRGKCRHCQGKISLLYPVIECGTGFLFMFSYMKFGWQFELIIALLLVSMLMIIFVTDLTYMVIPNHLLLFFLLIFLLLRIIYPIEAWYFSILGMVGGFSLIAVIIYVSRGGMGAGDMKLFAVLGLVLGIAKILLTFSLAAFLGSCIGALLLLLKKVHRKQPIPFAPYIAVAALISYFYGDSIISWYSSLFS